MPSVIAFVLGVNQETVGPVIQNEDLDRDSVILGRGEFLIIEGKSAVSHSADNRFFTKRIRCSDSRRNRVSKRSASSVFKSSLMFFNLKTCHRQYLIDTAVGDNPAVFWHKFR